MERGRRAHRARARRGERGSRPASPTSPVARLVTSPLQRCRETAELLLPGATAEVVDDLGECHYGAWTGRPIAELDQGPAVAHRAGRPRGRALPRRATGMPRSRSPRWPTGSSPPIRRIDAEVEAERGPDAVWVAVSHGDPIKAVLADAIGAGLAGLQRVHVDPASVSVMRRTGEPGDGAGRRTRPVTRSARADDAPGDGASGRRHRRGRDGLESLLHTIRNNGRRGMHVPDGFLDAPTSVATAVVAAGGVALALRRARTELDDRTAPLAGLVAVFVFAAQMLNFPVGAGTSGHLLGGTLAAVLVGPWTATLCLTVVLAVQSLLFADGGITALGTNVILMGARRRVVRLARLRRPAPGAALGAARGRAGARRRGRVRVRAGRPRWRSPPCMPSAGVRRSRSTRS